MRFVVSNCPKATLWILACSLHTIGLAYSCEQILEMVRTEGSKRGLETSVELWGFFISQCRNNLHVILCMSPIGSAFRDRLRQNPSIANCCTIDWFQKWPTDALEAVANKFLKEMDLEESLRAKLVACCKSFHKKVRLLMVAVNYIPLSMSQLLWRRITLSSLAHCKTFIFWIR